jgi:hypothetical protein
MLTLIPKVAESDALKDLRPISLLEPMRKVWCTLLLRKIYGTWERFDVLAHTRHGGRSFRSTESAIAQLQNLIDHATDRKRPLLVALWDIVHAFDSISKNVLRSAWARLGVPPDIAHWLTALDIGGGVIPKSPSARHHLATTPAHMFPRVGTTNRIPCFFDTKRGVGQGCPLSPLIWAAVFDILLRALLIADSPATMIPARGTGESPSPDTAFVDNLYTLAHDNQAFQAKLDIMSAFSLAFGLTINVTKLQFLAYSIGPVPTHFNIHTHGWTPQPVAVRTSGSIRYLGLHFDVTPDRRKLRFPVGPHLHLRPASMHGHLSQKGVSRAQTYGSAHVRHGATTLRRQVH